MDNKVKFQIKFLKENNRMEFLNRVQMLKRFFNYESGLNHDLCNDCSNGDLCAPKLAKPSSSRSWKRQGNEIIRDHLNTYHGHKYQVSCINIKRRKPQNQRKSKPTSQATSQTAAQSASKIAEAGKIDAPVSQRPIDATPTKATLLSDRLKSISSQLSTELSHGDERQLNEQLKQQLSREIGELKMKLDLMSNRYNLATDFQTRADASASYQAASFVQPPAALPLNTFILIPMPLTQPSVGATLNQLNPSGGELRGPGQLDSLMNQSRPTNLPGHLNGPIVGQPLPNHPSCEISSSHFLCDDNFIRVRDLDDINQNQALLNIIQQQQLSMARSNPKLANLRVPQPSSAFHANRKPRPANPDQQPQQKV